MDASVGAELTGRCNCTVYACWICCNDRDHWRWL